MQCVFHAKYSFGTKNHCTERCKTINNLRRFSLLLRLFLRRRSFFGFVFIQCFSWANIANAPANGIILFRMSAAASSSRSKKKQRNIQNCTITSTRTVTNNWRHAYYMGCCCSCSWPSRFSIKLEIVILFRFVIRTGCRTNKYTHELTLANPSQNELCMLYINYTIWYTVENHILVRFSNRFIQNKQTHKKCVANILITVLYIVD